MRSDAIIWHAFPVGADREGFCFFTRKQNIHSYGNVQGFDRTDCKDRENEGKASFSLTGVKKQKNHKLFHL